LNNKDKEMNIKKLTIEEYKNLVLCDEVVSLDVQILKSGDAVHTLDKYAQEFMVVRGDEQFFYVGYCLKDVLSELEAHGLPVEKKIVLKLPAIIGNWLDDRGFFNSDYYPSTNRFVIYR
jgi:hypothetical protein